MKTRHKGIFTDDYESGRKFKHKLLDRLNKYYYVMT